MALVFWQLCPVWIRRARACRFKHYLFSGSLAAWCGVSSIYESYSARHFINWNPAKKFSKSASVSFSQFAPESRQSETGHFEPKDAVPPDGLLGARSAKHQRLSPDTARNSAVR